LQSLNDGIVVSTLPSEEASEEKADAETQIVFSNSAVKNLTGVSEG
jgi:hypothetical protein